jgi:hypothetical protein
VIVRRKAIPPWRTRATRAAWRATEPWRQLGDVESDDIDVFYLAAWLLISTFSIVWFPIAFGVLFIRGRD